jgi:putative intracellular protease/amidase
LYDNVELLDFAGPGEVFSSAGFNTYTVSVDGKELTSQQFVKIKPEYAIENAPIPDIIVFPGGNSGPSANDPVVLDWIKRTYGNGTNFMSVCTGAFILAKAGLLENKRVTTHWGSTKSLGRQYPTSTVLEDTRWVDNDFVITTAGVSAGIDGALHFVARIKGNDAAKRTARYMEYDKWNPDNGVIDAKNAHLEQLITGNKSDKTIQSKAPFPGEYLNYSNALIAKGDISKAKIVVEESVKLYPHFDELYKALRIVKQKSGEAVPTDESELIGMVRDGKLNEALARYEKDKKAFPGWHLFGEGAMNDAGYFLLLEKKDVPAAIRIFELNTKEFPNSANTFDSLGEAQLIAGDKKAGIESYQKAAAMGLPNAKKVLKELGVAY